MLKVTQMTRRDSKPARFQRSPSSCLLGCLVSILLNILSSPGCPTAHDWLGPRDHEIITAIITARAVAAAGIPITAA